MGLERTPGPDLWLDVCPPSLRPDDAVPAQLMRWCRAIRRSRWRSGCTPRGDRPRVTSPRYPALQRRRPAGHGPEHQRPGVEVVVGAPENVAAELRDDLPDVRVGWVPLDVLAPTCDIIMHHGGGGTDMTALNAGVPQLIANPEYPTSATRKITEYGAALLVESDDERTEEFTNACKRAARPTPPTVRSAKGLSREMAELPPPAAMVGEMEKLVAAARLLSARPAAGRRPAPRAVTGRQHRRGDRVRIAGTAIPGAYIVTPRRLPDERGCFYEACAPTNWRTCSASPSCPGRSATPSPAQPCAASTRGTCRRARPSTSRACGGNCATSSSTCASGHRLSVEHHVTT